jgi:hypothetical protein
MKCFLLLLLLCVFFGVVRAQRSITDLRSLVEEADSLSARTQKIFYLYKIGPKNNSQKETWYYTMKNGRPVMFEVRFYQDSTEVTEVYYIDNGRLICSEEYETMYPRANEDRIAYGNINYFDNTLVRQVVTMGTSKYKPQNQYTFYNVIDRFRKRFAELKENIH